jgi:hypothetical protein
VANTPRIGARLDPALTDAAREGIGRPDLPLSLLIRTGLGVLAGLPVDEALAQAHARPGRPQTR